MKRVSPDTCRFGTGCEPIGWFFCDSRHTGKESGHMIQHARLNIVTDVVRSREEQRSAFLGLLPIRNKALGDARTAGGSTGTPVLTVPSRAHGPLGIARSLGRLGGPSDNAEFDAFASSFVSAYSQGQFRLPGSSDV